MTRRSGLRRTAVEVGSTGAIFSRNLRRLCKSRGLTPDAIPKRLGFDRKRVERLLAGELVPGLAVAREISHKLKFPLRELLRGL